MTYFISILFAIGAGLLGIGLYLMFSPKYNTTEDYGALLPMGLAALIFVLALIVWGGRALFNHFA